MSEQIARQWLHAAAESANQKDHAAHMALISRRVSLHGVPGYEHLDYDDWSAQTAHEFSNNLLKSVRYEGFKLITATEKNIMFKTFETVEGTDGTVNAQGIELLLEKEDDGQWRLIQERILPDDETAHDGLLPTE